MKLFLVRRTRSFIKQNFATLDPANNRRYLEYPDGRRSYFPDRIPKAVKFKTAPGDQYSRLYSAEMISMMESLSLPRYGLLNYFDEKKRGELQRHEKQLIDNLSKAGERMMGFAKSTFFKRIDSGGYSYLLTLCRHILRNAVYFYAIEKGLDLPVGDSNSIYDAFSDDDTGLGGDTSGETKLAFERDGKLCISTDWNNYLKQAQEYYEILRQKNNCSWINPKYFKRTLKQKLKSDSKTLINMISLCGEWDPATDQKLNELHRLLTSIHAEEKVLVFTQYADTANYLATELKKRKIEKVYVSTGGCKNQTTIVERFSPVSNEANIDPDRETRVLVATDVLSEGQNLQDSHVIVNFDLPWAIIRLIQRAGRVDRIGQKAEKIYCYSFFPADGVEKIINLRGRLNDRINENAKVVGSDEIFFEGNEQNLRDMFNEKSGILDDDDDNDVDLASQAYQIWANAIKQNPRLAQIIPALPNVIYSTKATADASDDGVITYAKTYNDFDVLTWLNSKGEVMSQSQKRILQAMACDPSTPCQTPLPDHHELVAKAVEGIAQENRSAGGILGNRFSTRSRIHNLLVDYLENSSENTLFFSDEQRDQLKLAIDEIYRYPFLSGTKFYLGRMLNARKSSDEIVDYVLEMRKTGNLCNIPKEDMEINRDPSIICSMGLKHPEI